MTRTTSWLRWLPLHFVPKPNVSGKECLQVEEASLRWKKEILDYLKHEIVLANKCQARKVRMQAVRYILVVGKLYRRGFSLPLLKCLDWDQANYVLWELHEGICGLHSKERTIATIVLKASYYWPTLRIDCSNFVKKCIQCHRHDNLIHRSAEELHLMVSPWSFAIWE